MKKTLCLAAAALLTLSGCGGGGGGGSSTSTLGAGGSSTTQILGVSGTQVDISGTWASTCATQFGGTDFQEGLVFTSATGTPAVVYAQFSYTTTNATCGGIATETASYTATVTAGAAGTGAVSGWEFSPGVVGGAPNAQDGTGPLLTNESFTHLTFTITAITGTFVGVIANGTALDNGYVLDDTTPAATMVLYRLKGGATPQTLANPAIAESFDSFSK